MSQALTTDEGHVEPESREGTGATRSVNVVHLLAREPGAVAAVLAGAVDRARAEADGLRVLVVVPGVDDALELSAALMGGAAGAPVGAVLPVTSLRRARRALAGPHAPAVVIATPDQLTALVEQSLLKLETVRVAALVWLEQLLGEAGVPAMETLSGDLPRDAERIVFATALPGDADAFLERFMWRARRVSHPGAAASADVPVRYLVTSAAARGEALRGVLDALDPDRALVLVSSDASAAHAAEALAVLGYRTDSGAVEILRDLPDVVDGLVIFFDEPAGAEPLRRAFSEGRPVVVLVTPPRLPRLRALAGADCAPLAPSRAFQAARTAEDRLRDELRGVARSGAAQSQLAVLEPLCGELDPVEVAAAALHLLQRERRPRPAPEAPAAQVAPVAAPPRPMPGAASGMTRLYFNVGEQDGVRPGDLVGAITGESGITGAQVGRIELHERFAIVEVESSVAERVVQRLTGTSIRGRRVVAREDQPREGPPRGRPREGMGRAPRAAGTRTGAERTPPAPSRLPRATEESREWTERAERLRQSRRRPRGEP